MAEVTERAILNEAALKRLDPFLKRVVDYAKFVAVYTFTLNENKWEKTGVEGTLFVYSRYGEPLYNVLVLNRLNMKNLIEPICSKLILQLHEPFLLYLNCKCALYGIWFYDRDECNRIASLLENLVEESGVSHHNSPSGSPTLQEVNISHILLRAEEAYKRSRYNGELTAAKSDDEEEGAVGGVIDYEDYEYEYDDEEHELEDYDDDDDEKDNTPQSVMDFFARAGCAPINAQMGLMPGITQTDGDDSERAAMDPVIHQIISNPSHSVEHIEKQQKMASSQKREQREQKSERLMRSIIEAGEITRELAERPDPNVSLMEFVSKNQKLAPTFKLMPKPLRTLALMPPSMFAPPNPKLIGIKEDNDDSSDGAAYAPAGAAAAAPIDDGDEADVDEDYCPPVSYPVTFPAAEAHNRRVNRLTRNQLLQAMNHLFQNDPTFIRDIHEAYLKSLGDRFP